MKRAGRERADAVNVLLITARADHGGGPRHMDFLINHRPDRINWFVAAPGDRPYYNCWKESGNVIDVVEIPHRRFSVLSFFKLVRYALRQEIRIIHSHGKGAGLYSRGMKLFCRRAAVVHSFHGLHAAQYGTLKRTGYVLYEKMAALLTDRFINVSSGEQESALELGIYGREKSSIIYNGTGPLVPVEGAREALGLSGKFVVMTVTRYDYAKNMNTALEIAERLRSYDDMVLLWIGEGEERSALEARAQEKKLKNVIFADFTDEIPKYLSAADIYLSTSRREGLPMALLEACSMGVPIVASDVVGNNEVVSHGHNGFLFPLSSPDDAVESILNLYRDRETLMEMSSNARREFNEKFRVERMVAETEALYGEVVGNKQFAGRVHKKRLNG